MRPGKPGMAVLLLLFGGACSKPASPSPQRAALEAVGPASVKVLPTAGQLPYCLLFTASERGVVRQLVPAQGAPERTSMPCSAGEPVGGVPHRIPPREGKVRLFLIFSDQPVKADGVGLQIHESVTGQRQLTGMDLRAPGQVQIETLEFTPSGER